MVYVIITSLKRSFASWDDSIEFLTNAQFSTLPQEMT